MASLSTCFVEKTTYMREEEIEEEEEEEEEEEVKGEEGVSAVEKAVETTDQSQPTSDWAPHFFQQAGKEVYNYVGRCITIAEAFDSYAGMIWPAALALCHYLDTHREQLSLVDKTVLEIGAGTGLVSIVAALLGGQVTATDLPEVLGNLRFNLCRNTRAIAPHTPQVAALSWGFDLERTYPPSVHRYDYVLAADVVYHHDYLDELLVTMKHFCRPGTTLIWANKVRFETDLTFTENFKKAFETSLLAEDGEVKIFQATSREETDDLLTGMMENTGKEKSGEGDVEQEHCDIELDSVENGQRKDVDVESDTLQTERREEEEKEEEEEEELECDGSEEDEEESEGSHSCNTNIEGQESIEQEAVQENWTPNIRKSQNKDIYHYVGQDILIRESFDSHGAVMWPAALALCSFLDTNRHTVDLQGKEVLELGAGTGLVAIVASLLGGAVTATDLPDVLGNLEVNVMRNTRGRCRHTPQVAALAWGYELERTYPCSVYRYDYVLAADVVYYDCPDELLVTMKHFCRPGTTLIWANKVRFVTDLTFTENFKKAFETSLLAEDGGVKIFQATSREGHMSNK